MTENVRETGLTARQIKALEFLSIGGRLTGAATAAGVSERTVRRWTHEPAFAAELRRLESELLQRLGRRLLGLGDMAAAALQAALQPDAAMSQRLRAADLVTSRGPQLAELTQLVARLEALERRLGDAQNGNDCETGGAG